MIEQQHIANGHLITVGPPKTAPSRLLREHRRRQRAEQRTPGDTWQDSGYVFITEDGAPLHPDYLTRRHLVLESGLPPVRLHDLRHGAASPAHCADVDLKTVQGRAHRRHLHPRPDRPAGLPGGSHRPARPRRRCPRSRTSPARQRPPAEIRWAGVETAQPR
ncbi:hypothetical protein ACFQFC_18075 [Amorphoplanes digitatis]|uniref:Integrase n=1 Tax=Actinoplanes digitatis TaxID=1868 RepID=A0A7W7I459_9ACTN|nr:hypothetical protein [Actinoplanes digitatis]MBB4766122.1 integrase [Actinoplanes digitatis]GID96546.1 hypothetical protein Adi01nite_59580 [Actinoplanes digitatis]